jgi:hypothetical protein
LVRVTRTAAREQRTLRRVHDLCHFQTKQALTTLRPLAGEHPDLAGDRKQVAGLLPFRHSTIFTKYTHLDHPACNPKDGSNVVCQVAKGSRRALKNE